MRTLTTEELSNMRPLYEVMCQSPTIIDSLQDIHEALSLGLGPDGELYQRAHEQMGKLLDQLPKAIEHDRKLATLIERIKQVYMASCDNLDGESLSVEEIANRLDEPEQIVKKVLLDFGLLDEEGDE